MVFRIYLLTCLFTSVLAGQDSLVLSIDTTLALEEITVRAAPIAHGELASRTIRQMDIYQDPSAKADPLLAVNSLPASTTMGETANVSLRGSSVGATGVYLNDIPLRSAVRIDQVNGVGQFSIFGQVPLERVDIYASAPPVRYSQVAAGAVALTTSDNLPTATTHGISLNIFGAGYSQSRPIGKQGGLNGFFNINDGRLFRGLNGRKLADLKRSRGVDGMLTYQHRFKHGGKLRTTYLAFRENYRYQLRIDTLNGPIDQRRHRDIVLTNYERPLGGWSLRLDHSIDLDRPDFDLLDDRIRIRQANHYFATRLRRGGPGRTLEFGILGNHYRDRSSGITDGGEFNLRESRTVVEAYGSIQRRIGRNLLWGGGVKPVFSTDELRWTAQSSLRWQIGESHRIHLAGGQFQQLISPNRTNPGWAWLRSRQIAVEYHLSAGAWTGGAASYVKSDRLANDATAIYGAELWGEYQRNDWKITTAVNAFEREAAGFILARTRVQWQVGNNWSLGAAHNSWTGARRPYHRLDASANYTFIVGEGVVVAYININNLPDRENFSHYSVTDGGEQSEETLSRRVVFFGAVYNW